MWDLVKLISPYAIAYTMPLLITALGGLYSERSGIVNIGLEGLMIVGAFSGAISTFYLQTYYQAHIAADLVNPYMLGAVWLGLLIGMAAGALFSLLHAFASVTLNANQTISGTAINMIATALTLFFARYVTGSGNITLMRGMGRTDVPLLSRIPVLGDLLFKNTYNSTWLILALLLTAWFVLYKTPFGLRLRACGEHPNAANSAGVRVRGIRYTAVVISGAFAGLGGAVMMMTIAGEFSGSVSGFGFLALASLIFGQWKPLGILAATLFFGFATTFANMSQIIPALAGIPRIVFKTFPYAATLVALILFSKSSQAPRASGEIFDQAKR